MLVLCFLASILLGNMEAQAATNTATAGTTWAGATWSLGRIPNNTSEFGLNAAVLGDVHLTATKISAVISDTVNNTTNPKRIPGAVIEYSIMIANTNGGSPDSDTFVITDAIDSATLAFDVSAGVTFVDGATSSGLTLGAVTYSSTAAPGPYVYNYTPVPDGNGCDGAVTGVRIAMSGLFAKGGSPSPSFAVKFRARIKQVQR